MKLFDSLKCVAILLIISSVHLVGCSGGGPDSESLEQEQTQEVPDEMEDMPDANP